MIRVVLDMLVYFKHPHSGRPTDHAWSDVRPAGTFDVYTCGVSEGDSRLLLDPHPGDGPADHELLDLLGAFGDIVDLQPPSTW